MKRCVRFACAMTGVLVWPACLVAQTPDPVYEGAPVLAVSDLVPAPLILGPNHVLADKVRVEGNRGRYEIQSPQGSFSVSGRELLGLRVAELPAIEALGRINKGEAFGEALAKAAKAPLDFVGKLITAPGETLGSVATGVGQIVGKAGNVVKSGVDNVADGVSDIVTAKNPGNAGASGDAGGSDEPPPPSFNSDPFGYNKARRQWAKSLNVDPYTSNPVLGKLLDDAASATFAGSFAVDTALGLVAAPVKFAVGFDAESRDAIWDLSPGDIESKLEARLAVMGIVGRPVRDFFRNRWFTPTLQTGLVSALEKLVNVKGRPAVIDVAATLQGEANVRALIEALNLLADHHRKVASLDDLRSLAPLVTAGRADGETVAAISADYLSWSATTAGWAQRVSGAVGANSAVTQRTLLVSGRLSLRARQELERAGWKLVEAGLPRAEPVAGSPGPAQPADAARKQADASAASVRQ